MSSDTDNQFDNSTEILLPAFPNFPHYMKLHEWIHWYDILLAYRIQIVQQRTMGIKPVPGFRIQLPDEVRVPQPLWALLATLGKVSIPDMGYTYIPSLRMFTNPQIPIAEDLEAQEDGFWFDFVANWIALEDYHRRHPDLNPNTDVDIFPNLGHRPAREFTDDTDEFRQYDDESLQEYVTRLGEYFQRGSTAARETRNDADETRLNNHYTMQNGILVRREGGARLEEGAEALTRDALAHYVLNVKQRWAHARHILKETPNPTPDMMVEGRDTLQQNPELSVVNGSDIVYQPWLYAKYLRAVTIMKQFVHLSLDVPNDEGDIGWTLTVTQQGGFWQTNVPSKKETPLDSTLIEIVEVPCPSSRFRDLVHHETRNERNLKKSSLSTVKLKTLCFRPPDY